jgi:hypothetical protein
MYAEGSGSTWEGGKMFRSAGEGKRWKRKDKRKEAESSPLLKSKPSLESTSFDLPSPLIRSADGERRRRCAGLHGLPGIGLYDFGWPVWLRILPAESHPENASETRTAKGHSCRWYAFSHARSTPVKPVRWYPQELLRISNSPPLLPPYPFKARFYWHYRD